MERFESASDLTPIRPADLFQMTEIPQAHGYEGAASFIGDLRGFLDEMNELMRAPLGEKTSDIGIEVKDGYNERATEVMSDVFTLDVVKEWPSMSMEQRAEHLDRYAKELGETQGINLVGIVVSDLYAECGEGVVGYNSGDGYLHLDFRQLQDPMGLWEMVGTVTHEARHQLQHEAVANPDRFNIPIEMISNWAENIGADGHYINGNYNPEGYYFQTVEVDARNAEDTVRIAWATGLLS